MKGTRRGDESKAMPSLRNRPLAGDGTRMADQYCDDMDPGPSMAKKDGEIQSAMRNLARSTSELGDVVGQLHERLSVVCRDSHPTPGCDTEEGKPSNGCRVADTINTYADNVARQLSFLHDILNRLEL